MADQGVTERLDKIISLLEGLSEQFVKAEKEVPEYIRRHTMYLHDLFDMRYMTEQLGIPFDPQLTTEMERSLHRLGEIIEEEHYQGGAFHHSLHKLRRHRETHGKRHIHRGDPLE